MNSQNQKLRPGDLVAVIASRCDCGYGDKFIGRIYTLRVLVRGATIFCYGCNQNFLRDDAVWQMDSRGEGGFHASVLKKIPPLSELESQTDSISIRDPIYNTVP